MKYTFTDWDKRSYERQTSGKLKITSSLVNDDLFNLCILQNEQRILSLNISKREAESFILALQSSLKGFNINFEI